MSSELTPLLLLVVLLLVFWLVVLRPARNQQRNQRSLQDSLEVGDEVVISSGIFGTITALEDAQAHLEVAPGTVLRVARQVVVRRVEDDQPTDGAAQAHDAHEPGANEESDKPFAAGLLNEGEGAREPDAAQGDDAVTSTEAVEPETQAPAPAKKAPAKKAPAKKTPAKKTAAKKAPAKRAPAKKTTTTGPTTPDETASTDGAGAETPSGAAPEQGPDEAPAGETDRTLDDPARAADGSP